LRPFRILLLTAATLAALVSSASATVVTLGTGWSEGVITSAGGTSTDSPLTFTIAAGHTELFSLSDAYVPGDIWTVSSISGTPIVTTSTTAGARVFNFPNVAGDVAVYDTAWTDPSYGHLQLVLGAGTYSLDVTGTGAGGLPAHFGYRLDVAAAVPEPSTWAMMTFGFFGIGLLAYRRKNGRLRLA
jgi:hypothetical protein